MKWRATYLLILVFLLQTLLGVLFRQFEPSEFVQISATQTIALFFPTVIYLLIYHMPEAALQGRGLTGINALFSVLLMLGTAIISQYVNAPMIQLLARAPSDAVAEPQIPQTAFEVVLAVVFLCLIPAIIEEILFRGIVLREYSSSFGSGCAILLTAAIYTILHFDLSACLPQFLIGLVTGLLVYRTGTLICGMIAHFSNNFLGLMIQVHTAWFAEILTTHMWPTVAVACGLLIIAGWGLFLYNPRNSA